MIQQEIESYEFLLMERTLSGKMKDTKLLYRSQPGSESPSSPQSCSGSLRSVHEEDETNPSGVELDPTFGGDEVLPSSTTQDELDPEFENLAGEEEEVQDRPTGSDQNQLTRDKINMVLIGAGVKTRKKPRGEVLGDFAVTGR